MKLIHGCINGLVIVALVSMCVLGLVMILDGGWGIPLGIAVVLAAATLFGWRFVPQDEGWVDDGNGI